MLKSAILLLISVNLAHAKMGEPNSQWCQDLGIYSEDIHGNEISGCHIDPQSQERSELIKLLASTDPYKFLPEELAAQVELCRKARNEKNPLYRYTCRTLAPLRDGRLSEILFVPKDQVERARLGKTGARVVVDCKGRHLQIRADLPPEQQFAFIKQSFSTMLMEATSKKLAEKFTKTAKGSKYQTCDLSGKKNSVKTFDISWHASKSVYFMVWDEKKIPEAYIPPGCVPENLTERKKAKTKSEELVELQRQLLQADEDWIENECTNVKNHDCFTDVETYGIDKKPDRSRCGEVKIPKACDELNSFRIKNRTSKTNTTAEIESAILTLALEKPQHSAERMKLLVKASEAYGMDFNYSDEFNHKSKELIDEEIPILCEKDPCACFSGKVGVNLAKRKGIEDICMKADLKSCAKDVMFGTPKETFCKLTAGTYEPPGSTFEKGLDLKEEECEKCDMEGGFLPWGD